MNTKEAIRSLMDLCDDELNPFHVRSWYKERDEIIKLLKENENYKKIVEEIDERLMPGKVNVVDNHTNMGELSTLEFVRLIIKDIKEK